MPTLAQTVIVNEDFESYPTFGVDGGAAFKAVWVETVGNGTAAAPAADANAGIVTDDASTFPGIEGKAVDHLGATASTPGMVNQWGGIIDQTSAQNPDFQINPSATENVFLSADIFVGTSGNERMTVGLRHTNVAAGPVVTTSNILELGCFNANPTVLGIPNTTQESANFAFRIINFGAATIPETTPPNQQPNWQYFQLPAELDRATDLDSIVNVADVGAGWHTYTATMSPTQITLTMDLFRDGLRNTSITPDEITGIRPGTPGVDATITLNVATLSAGFNNLRIGGPSGNSSLGSGAMGFDNILLQLQSSVVPPTDDADFDGDGDIDGADFLTWQENLGAVGTGTLLTGDANGDTDVDGDDLSIWRTQYATAVPAVASIPEPASAALAAVALLAGLATTRRR